MYLADFALYQTWNFLICQFNNFRLSYVFVVYFFLILTLLPTNSPGVLTNFQKKSEKMSQTKFLIEDFG